MEHSNGHHSPPDTQFSILTDRQQLAASLVLGVCILVMFTSWGLRKLRREHIIDVDRPFERRQVELTIDLNQATWPELTLLPEISETMARRIVEFRDMKGRFQSLDELKQVRGIGPRTFQQVRPYLDSIQPIPVTASQP